MYAIRISIRLTIYNIHYVYYIAEEAKKTASHYLLNIHNFIYCTVDNQTIYCSTSKARK